MSGMRAAYNNTTHTVLFGAPEFLSSLAPLSKVQKDTIATLTSEGKRVLLVASFSDSNTPLKKLPAGSGEAIGIIVLANPLRTDVEKTVAYLQKNNVSIRVISGDNPQTVQYVAETIGIIGSQNKITGAELAELADEAWDKTVLETTIFARVLPEQKEHIIATFKKHGEFTGMVGDGVNDALALKKADLGIAMYAGAAATRRVADIVLLNNSFTALPTGMKLGNRIMQAIEVISILFFHKIIYGITLLLATLALHIRYPFQPRHITFMNLFLVVLPTVMWTLFPPRPKHRIQPQHFWRDTLVAVLPIGLLSGAGLALSYLLMTALHPHDQAAISTSLVIVTTFFGVYLVFLAPKLLAMKNTKNSQAARIFYVLSIAIFALLGFGTHIVRSFFDFVQPDFLYIWPAILVVAAIAGLQYVLAVKIGNAHERSLANR
jgi:cation-transporting ATPase E